MSNRESLKETIVNLYGEVTHKKVRELEHLRKKRARILSSIAFLKRCRNVGVTPVCVRITPKPHIWKSASVLRDASDKLLRNLIRSHRFHLSELSVQLYSVHLELAKVLCANLFTLCDAISFEQGQRELELCTAQQVKKFDRLLAKKRVEQRPADVNKECVVNLSSHSLQEEEVAILSKGMNFAITPRRIPVEEIIGNIEECMVRERIPKGTADEIRQDAAVILRRAKLPPSNITREESLALRTLRQNQNIVILPADKGNATVVLNTEDYTAKISALLSDENTYRKVNFDPTARTMRKVTTILSKHRGMLPSFHLKPSCPQPPKIYGLPKIHKEGAPLRPVVSQISSPTYDLAKYMAKKLSPLIGRTTSFVRDSSHFVEIIKDLRVEDTEVLVSFDVESLFTNVPVEECLSVIKDLLVQNEMYDEYYEVTELCLKSGYFLWNGEFFLQIEGVAMGSPISPVVANIWMEYFEHKALATSPIKPKIWLRYVDDTFCIVDREDVNTFLSHLNGVHPRTKFTMEVEENGTLAFLDVKITRKQDRTLGHTVYRKPTHTDRYLHATSHHHPANLRSVVSALVNRAHRICNSENLNAELKHVDAVLERNGYTRKQRRIKTRRYNETPVQNSVAFMPYLEGVTDRIGKLLKRHDIKTIFKPPAKIRQLLRTVKDTIPLQTPGVYAIPCSCGSCYIGQTKRSISVRMQEHIKAMRNNDPHSSAIAEHVMDPTEVHWVRFDQVKVLSTERHLIPRLVREAIEIRRHQNFNRDNSFNLSATWTPVLNSTQKTQSVRLNQQPDIISSVCRQHQSAERNGSTHRYNLRSGPRGALVSPVRQ